MNRTDLIQAICYRTNKNVGTLNADTVARLLTFLNERQRRLLTLPGLTHLRDTTVTFDSVADQANYTLPNIAKINRLFETTNDRVLWEMSQQDYRLVQPNTTITGTPEAFVWQGRQAVAQQPSDASSLFVVSTSASDTSIQTATVTGVITGNFPRTTGRQMNGTTPVDVSPTIATWTRIDKFYMAGLGSTVLTPTGAITLLEDSGTGTELARINPGQTQTHYAGFSLYPTPSSAITYQVDVTRTVTDIAAAGDEPLLPLDFHDVLLLGALMDEYQHLSDERYAMAAREYQQRINEMRYWLAETDTGKPMNLSRPWGRPSQLGSWYPAGS